MWLFKNLMQLIVFFPFFFSWKKQFINQIFLADPLILTGFFLAQIDQGAGNIDMKFSPNVSNNPSNAKTQRNQTIDFHKLCVIIRKDRGGKVLNPLTEMYVILCTKDFAGNDRN